MKRFDTCLVIGAGIAGIMAAVRLTEAGIRVIVLEKSRGLGGRMATRRIEEAVFDHGAQFVSPTLPAFLPLFNYWSAHGVVSAWSRTFPGMGSPPGSMGFFRGVPSMTSVAKFLSHALEVRLQQKVVKIRHDSQRWFAWTDIGDRYEAGAIVCTAPLPQTLTILDEGNVVIPPPLAEELQSISYYPCLSILLTLTAPSQIPPPGGCVPDIEGIRWVADNRQKGISPQETAVTVLLDPETSSTQFSLPDASLHDLVVGRLSGLLGAPIRSYHVHRWRFSEPMHHFNESAVLALDQPPLVLAGDAFGAPRVEGAALSGMKASSILLQLNL